MVAKEVAGVPSLIIDEGKRPLIIVKANPPHTPIHIVRPNIKVPIRPAGP